MTFAQRLCYWFDVYGRGKSTGLVEPQARSLQDYCKKGWTDSSFFKSLKSMQCTRNQLQVSNTEETACPWTTFNIEKKTIKDIWKNIYNDLNNLNTTTI